MASNTHNGADDRAVYLSSVEEGDRLLQQSGGLFLHPDSELRRQGQQLILSWNFYGEDAGLPPSLVAPVGRALLRLGAATFPYLGSWTEPFESRRDTTAWLLDVPLKHRLRAWIREDRAPRTRKIRFICTRLEEVLCEQQLGWGERFLGYVIVTANPLDASNWNWNEARQFSAGIVDDRSGAVAARNPLAIVVPGTDADMLWIWCAKKAISLLRDSLSIVCRDAGLAFHAKSSDQLQ